MRFAHKTIPKQSNKLDFPKAKPASSDPDSQLKESNDDSNCDYALSESESEEEPPQIDGSEDNLIRVPGIENYDIGVSEDEASSEEESESEDSEDEANIDESDADTSSDEE